MAMFDFDRPSYIRQNPKDHDVYIDKIYHVAFFNGDKLDTRPIKIIDMFLVGDNIVRLEVNWEYYFEVEKTATTKLADKRLWKRFLGISNEIIETKITEGYMVKSVDDNDMFNFDLIGATPEIAMIKPRMVAKKTPYPTQEKIDIINNAIEEFQETSPDLLIKAMDWKLSDHFGDITNYASRFLVLEDDIRNR